MQVHDKKLGIRKNDVCAAGCGDGHVTFLGEVFLSEPVDARGLFDGPYILNLEAPITQRDTPVAGKILLRTTHNHLEVTFGQKPLAVCLANNHVMDYGLEGLADTFTSLEHAGFLFLAQV